VCVCFFFVVVVVVFFLLEVGWGMEAVEAEVIVSCFSVLQYTGTLCQNS